MTYWSDRASDILKNINSDEFWMIKQKEICQDVIDHGIEHFLSFKALSDTMVINNTNYIGFEYSQLPQHISSKLIDPSPNEVHQAYHLSQLNDLSGISTVIEFGGGYGSMRRVVDQVVGPVNYSIYDLPAMALLQQYHLYDIPTSYLTDLPRVYVNLFIGLWSVSECPIAFREHIFKQIQAKHYLIAFQDQFEDIDNLSYFRNLGFGTIKKIDHLYGGQYYFIA